MCGPVETRGKSMERAFLVLKGCLVHAHRGLHSCSTRRSRDHAAHRPCRAWVRILGGYVSCLTAWQRMCDSGTGKCQHCRWLAILPELATLGNGNDNRKRLFCCFGVMERPHSHHDKEHAADQSRSASLVKETAEDEGSEAHDALPESYKLPFSCSFHCVQPPPYCQPGLYLLNLRGTLPIRFPVSSSAVQWLGACMYYVSQCYTRGTKSLSLNFVWMLDCHQFKRSYVLFNLSTLRSLWNRALPFILSGT